MTPEEMVTDDVTALLASLEGTAGADRRRHTRSSTKGCARAVVRRAGAGLMRVTVRDLSCSGVGLYAQGAMDVGAEVEVELEAPGRTPLRAVCRVASCRLEADGRYVVGMEFVRIVRAAMMSEADAVAERLAGVLASEG